MVSEIEEVLAQLKKTNEIEGVVIIRNGISIASTLPEKTNAGKLGIIGAEIVRSAERFSSELKCGSLLQLIIECEDGKIVSTGAGESTILLCLVKPTEEIGEIQRVINKTAERIAEILEKKKDIFQVLHS